LWVKSVVELVVLSGTLTNNALNSARSLYNWSKFIKTETFAKGIEDVLMTGAATGVATTAEGIQVITKFGKFMQYGAHILPDVLVLEIVKIAISILLLSIFTGISNDQLNLLCERFNSIWKYCGKYLLCDTLMFNKLSYFLPFNTDLLNTVSENQVNISLSSLLLIVVDWLGLPILKLPHQIKNKISSLLTQEILTVQADADDDQVGAADNQVNVQPQLGEEILHTEIQHVRRIRDNVENEEKKDDLDWGEGIKF
jgi:hypothetical protein